MSAPPLRTKGDLLRAAAALSLAAGFIHVLAVKEHLEEWWGYGLFFLFASAAQIYYGFAMGLASREPSADDRALPQGDQGFFLFGLPRRTWYLLGVLGNLAIIALYVVTRTVGIPALGPAAGEVEAVTVFGVVSKTTEAVLVLVLVLLLRAAPAPERAPEAVAQG